MTAKTRLCIYGGCGLLAVLAASATAGGLGIAVPSFLIGAKWLPSFVNTIAESIGFELGSSAIQEYMNGLEPKDHLKNEDIHAAIGRTISAVIRQQVLAKTIDKKWSKAADFCEKKFRDMNLGAPILGGKIEEGQAAGWVTGTLDDIHNAKPLDKNEWHIFLAEIARNSIQEVPKDVESLAKILEDQFGAAFFGIITADTASNRVAFNKILLLQSGSGFQAITSQQDEIAAALGLQLDATVWPKPKPDSIQRFDYRCRVTQYVGNYASANQAKAFLDHEDPFRWLTVTGPSGQGKNRFVLELSLFARSMGWNAGLLGTFGPNLATCILDDKSLVIVDDLSANAEVCLNLLKSGFARMDGKKIRIILLCRNEQNSNVSAFKKALQNHIPNDLEDQSIHLSTLDENERRVVAQSIFYFHNAGHLFDKTYPRLERAANVDSSLQAPLWFAFAADALARANGATDSFSWDRQSLAAAVIDREWARWEALLGDEIEEAALAVFKATLLGQEVKTAFPPGKRDLLSELAPASDPESVAPLKPDPVGELFVLLRLQRNDPLRSQVRSQMKDITEKGERIVEQQWKESESSALAVLSFRHRCLENFPELVMESALAQIPQNTELPKLSVLLERLRETIEDSNANLKPILAGLLALVKSGHASSFDQWSLSWALNNIKLTTPIQLSALSDFCHKLILIQSVNPLVRAYCCESVAKMPGAEEFRADLNTEAARLLRQAILVDPKDRFTKNILGNLLTRMAQGSLGQDLETGNDPAALNSEAARLYRLAIAEDSKYGYSKFNLASLLRDLAKGHPGTDPEIGDDPAALNTEAARLYRLAILDDPKDSFSKNSLASLLRDLAKGHPGTDPEIGDDPAALNTEAARLYRLSIQDDPNGTFSKTSLANLLTEMAKGHPGKDPEIGDDPASLNTEAARLYRESIQDDPRKAYTKNMLAGHLRDLAKGHPGQDTEIGVDPSALNTEAARLYRMALQDDPNDTFAKYGLANLLRDFAKGHPGQDAIIGNDPAILIAESDRLFLEAIQN